MPHTLTAGEIHVMQIVSDAYAKLADEYYDPFHKTCRNFDAATKAALLHRPVDIPADGLVLEVGSGRGRVNEFLGVSSGRVVQLDSSAQMLALTEREPSIVRVLADARSIPLFDKQFSAIVGFLIDPFIGLEFFSEAHRLLEGGGLLVFTTPAAEWGYALRGRNEPEVSSARFMTIDKNVVIVPSTLVPKTKIAEMLSFCGFESVSIHSEPLPAGTDPVSPDVRSAALKEHVETSELPLVYLVVAQKLT